MADVELFPDEPAHAARAAVALAAAELDGAWHGVWVRYDARVSVGRFSDRTSALRAALGDALSALPATALVDVLVDDERFAAALSAAAWGFPSELLDPQAPDGLAGRVHVPLDATGSYLCKRAAAFAASDGAVGQHCQKKAPPGASTSAGPVRRTIRAGCDGSKGIRRQSSWAFVTADGQHRSGFVAGPILVAELTAIARLLRAFPTADIEATTDSRDALRALRCDVHDLPAVAHVVARIRQSTEGRSVQLNWIAGHSGDPLNEAADRLARLARYRSEFAAGETDAAGVAAGTAEGPQVILRGILADLRVQLAS